MCALGACSSLAYPQENFLSDGFEDAFCTPGDGCNCQGLGDFVSQPPLAYSCALGIVDFSINTWAFSELGDTHLQVAGDGLMHVLSGPQAGCPGAMFSVSNVIPGVCTETYILEGAFSDLDNWSGQFSVTFTGSCLDCVNQSFNVSGSRPP
jgi:hypothetical protein